ncbi:MAG: IS630 transposase-related protein [Cyanobacteria bacterium P01_E01_bin.34]
MPYSLDLRERVVNYVRSGESIDEAVRLFKVSRATIYRWLNRPDLRATVVTRRRRKLDDQALMLHVREYPDAQLKDRAAHFNVHPTAIFYAFKRLNITRKKSGYVIPNATQFGDNNF